MKIAVFRALQLGDILCSIPALRTLRSNFSEAKLYYIGLPSMRHLVERYDFVDDYIDFPGYAGLPEQPYELESTERFIDTMCELQFDWLIQMHGNGSIVNNLLARCEAQRLVGFCPDQLSANTDWMIYPDDIHEVNRHLKLMEHLGMERSETKIEFPLSASDWMNFEQLKQRESLEQYAIVHVGSRSVQRQWPLENFAFLAQYLRSIGLQIVLTGTKAEQPLIAEMEQLLGGEVVNLAGKTDLGLLGCVVKEAQCLISNCTGISHIAAALETKSIVMSLDGEPERWGPLNHQLHYTYDATQSLLLYQLLNDLDKLLSIR